MRKRNKKLLLATLIYAALQGCNSSKNSTPADPVTPDPPTLPPVLEVDDTLNLDYTLPLAALGIKPDVLAGATLNPETGEFIILGQGGQLVTLSPEGNVVEDRNLEIADVGALSGIEYIDSESFVVSSESSDIYLIDETDLTSELVTTLDFRVGGIAYDDQTASAIVVDDRSPSRIVFVSMDGTTQEADLTATLSEGSVEGVTLTGDTLVFASVDPDSANNDTYIVTSDLEGRIGPSWSIDIDSTTGLVVIDPEIPEILTTNNDPEQTITLFESPTPPSIPSEESLALSSSPDLDFDQPSGVDYSDATSELYYITDFGEVRLGNSDGENELLFEFDVMQGSFESIVINGENLSLMMSGDSSEQSFVTTLDFEGNMLSQFEVPLIDEEHQFESLDYDHQNNYFVAITATEGRKVFYRFTENKLIDTNELSEDYDDFIIAGMSIDAESNSVYFVTEEWTDENDVLNAGLFIRLDYDSLSETHKFSIAIDVEGELQGVKDPSDVAMDSINNQIFVTSDVDDSVLYVFEGF